MTEAQFASLDFDSFKTRLIEHFAQGYIIDDQSFLEPVHNPY